MGILRYSELTASAESSAPEQSSGTELISRVQPTGGWIPAHATRIGPSPDGQNRILYLDQVSVYWLGFREFWLPCTDRDISVTRLEVKAASSLPDVATGHCCLFAEFPYSSCLTAAATFKPVAKPERDELCEPPEAICRDAGRLDDWISAQSFDCWETDRFLTASLPGWGAKPDFVRALVKARYPKENTGQLLGLCQDYAKILKTLRGSSDWDQILTDTLAGRRRWWKSGASFIPLGDGIQVYLEDILLLAVRQAMAGPNSVSDSARWLKRPVMDKAGEIFDDHLNNLNRRQEGNAPTAGGKRGPQPPDEIPNSDPNIIADPTSVGLDLSHAQLDEIASNFEIDRNGAVYLMSTAKTCRLDQRDVETQKRAMALLAQVYRKGGMGPGGAAIREAVEEALESDGLEDSLPELERWMRSLPDRH